MTINIAIVGTGGIAGNYHAPAIKKTETVNLWSVCNVNPKSASDFARKHHPASPTPVYTDLTAMLRDPELDAVLIATPDKLHAKQVIESAKAGKHILVEKPMATDLQSAREMIRICDKFDVRLAVGYHLRRHPGHRKLIDMIRSERIGNLIHMRTQWTWKSAGPADWRATTEKGQFWSLGGVGTHCLDMIRWFMTPSCGEITSIKSTISKNRWKGPHDESALVSMQFESGATAEFCSSVLFESRSRLELYGEHGAAICDGTLSKDCQGSISINDKILKYKPIDMYAEQLQEFISAIETGRPSAVDGREGIRNVEILEKIIA